MKKNFTFKEVRKLINLVTEWEYYFNQYNIENSDPSYLIHCSELEKSISEILGYKSLNEEARWNIIKLIVSQFKEN